MTTVSTTPETTVPVKDLRGFIVPASNYAYEIIAPDNYRAHYSPSNDMHLNFGCTREFDGKDSAPSDEREHRLPSNKKIKGEAWRFLGSFLQLCFLRGLVENNYQVLLGPTLRVLRP